MEYNDNHKNCAFCGMEIPSETGRCPYCGSLLDVKEVNDEEPVQSIQNSYQQDHRTPFDDGSPKTPLSNGLKVFLTVLFTVVPGFGQLAGIITGIIFMNSDDDTDRKSFGVALLVASIIMFVLSGIGFFLLILSFYMSQSFEFYGK